MRSCIFVSLVVAITGGSPAIAQSLGTAETLELPDGHSTVTYISPLSVVRESLRDGSRIIRGAPVTDWKTYSFQVSLIASAAKPGAEVDGHFCGGTLIDASWVLTAAHCVTEYGRIVDAASINTYLASVDFQRGERIGIKNIVIHPHFDPVYLDNDVALIELSHIPLSMVYPISIATGETAQLYEDPGHRVITIGWGETEQAGASRQLREVGLRVIGRQECAQLIISERTKAASEALSNLRLRLRIDSEKMIQIESLIKVSAGPIITDGMICAGDPYANPGDELVADACRGDSGGPLLVRTNQGEIVQIGIVSWGDGCGLPKRSGVFSRTAQFNDWIASIIGLKP